VSTGTESSSFKFEISKLLDGTFTYEESVNNNEDGEVKYYWVNICEIVGVTVEESWNRDKFWGDGLFIIEIIVEGIGEQVKHTCDGSWQLLCNRWDFEWVVTGILV